MGVRIFDPERLTYLATNWSKLGIGYWLFQKQCNCHSHTPNCSPDGWKTVMMGNRFCTRAEQKYDPVEGRAMAAAWAVNECRHFLLGLDKFTLAVDHK